MIGNKFEIHSTTEMVYMDDTARNRWSRPNVINIHQKTNAVNPNRGKKSYTSTKINQIFIWVLNDVYKNLSGHSF